MISGLKIHFQDLGHSFSYTDFPAGQYHKYINGRSHPALFLYFTIPEAKKVLKRELGNLSKYETNYRDLGGAFGYSENTSKILRVSAKVEKEALTGNPNKFTNGCTHPRRPRGS